MSNAPYRHSDGSDCYTKECSLGNVSVHTPRAGSFSRASANLRLSRPVEVAEEIADWVEPEYDKYGFEKEGVLSTLCDAGENGSPEVHAFLISNGITEKNGWAAAEGEWSTGRFGDLRFGGYSDEIAMEERAEYAMDVRTYDFVNAKTGATFSLYGSQDIEGGADFTTHLTRGAAIYEIWNGADASGDSFRMELRDSDLIEAVEFSSDPRLIRWAAANNPSSGVVAVMHSELLKMFPNSQDVPLQWLLKMID